MLPPDRGLVGSNDWKIHSGLFVRQPQIKERDARKEEATRHSDEELWKEYKELKNQAKHHLIKDKPKHLQQ